jgi:putative acetyltransferase
MKEKTVNVKLKTAIEPEDFERGRLLFRKYADSLNFNLDFQDFQGELNDIALQYNRPYGALILAEVNGLAAGCIGVRQFDRDSAELKRMFVLPACRNLNIGRLLLEKSLAIAGELKYKRVLLDTLPSMASAIKLYKSFGFVEIEPYRYNPFEEAVFMEKKVGV